MKDLVTSISSVGTIVTRYDTATFSLHFSEVDGKASVAKFNLKKGVDTIRATLDNLVKAGLVIDEGSLVTITSVQPKSEYDHVARTSYKVGMQATYRVVFNTQTLEMVNDIYDTLSDLNLNELSVDSPTFFVKNQSELKDRAIELAWKRVKEKLAFQAGVLGFSISKFKIAGFQVNYDGNVGISNYSNVKSMSLDCDDPVEGACGSPSGSSSIQLESGRATVRVALSVDYTFKK